jgi:hypothetical protein
MLRCGCSSSAACNDGLIITICCAASVHDYSCALLYKVCGCCCCCCCCAATVVVVYCKQSSRGPMHATHRKSLRCRRGAACNHSRSWSTPAHCGGCLGSSGCGTVSNGRRSWNSWGTWQPAAGDDPAHLSQGSTWTPVLMQHTAAQGLLRPKDGEPWLPVLTKKTNLLLAV